VFFFSYLFYGFSYFVLLCLPFFLCFTLSSFFPLFVFLCTHRLVLHETMFGFLEKQAKIHEELVQNLTLGYLHIPSLYVNLAFLLVDDT